MLNTMGKQAKTASRVLAVATTEQKNKALEAIAQALEANTETVLAANEKDLENGRSNGMSQALLDRLKLDEGRIRGIAAGVREVMALPDPIGRVLEETKRPNGLRLVKVSVPLGVIGIIFEARPNVSVDSAVLCLKKRQRGDPPGRQRRHQQQHGAGGRHAQGFGERRAACRLCAAH